MTWPAGLGFTSPFEAVLRHVGTETALRLCGGVPKDLSGGRAAAAAHVDKSGTVAGAGASAPNSPQASPSGKGGGPVRSAEPSMMGSRAGTGAGAYTRSHFSST